MKNYSITDQILLFKKDSIGRDPGHCHYKHCSCFVTAHVEKWLLSPHSSIFSQQTKHKHLLVDTSLEIRQPNKLFLRMRKRLLFFLKRFDFSLSHPVCPLKSPSGGDHIRIFSGDHIGGLWVGWETSLMTLKRAFNVFACHYDIKLNLLLYESFHFAIGCGFWWAKIPFLIILVIFNCIYMSSSQGFIELCK